jgi:small subunit ribosomal protein S6
MRLYDLVVVTRPSLSDAQRSKVLGGIKDFLKEMKVVKDENWGQKPLSYKIKREVAGVYHLLQLETEKSIPAGLEKKLVNEDSVIRHLLIRTK